MNSVLFELHQYQWELLFAAVFLGLIALSIKIEGKLPIFDFLSFKTAKESKIGSRYLAVLFAISFFAAHSCSSSRIADHISVDGTEITIVEMNDLDRRTGECAVKIRVHPKKSSFERQIVVYNKNGTELDLKRSSPLVDRVLKLEPPTIESSREDYDSQSSGVISCSS